MEVSATDYLKGQIKLLGYNYVRLSQLMGMSKNSLCDKVNNPSNFRVYELEKLTKLIKIPNEVLGGIVRGEKIDV